MTKKKKSKVAISDAIPNESHTIDAVGIVSEPQQPSSPIFLVPRNKNWRYTSAYRGTWLMDPVTTLESFANSDYSSLRPHLIDPATMFDLVKIRRLIDDATTLSVRAANGTTTSFATSSSGSMHGRVAAVGAELFGIDIARGGGTNAKLSRERKFRMREQATSKLSHAYCLDEIAACLATMEASSAVYEVAQHVLCRNEGDPDAQYVRFFNEKVPLNAVAESTSSEPLTEIIHQQPTEAAHYRTRATTRILSHDFVGAIQDLTEALTVHRLYSGHHKDNAKAAFGHTASTPTQGKLDEVDHPSSMEAQLLFLRAGVYLTLACQNVAVALRYQDIFLQQDKRDDDPMIQPDQHQADTQSCLEAERLVRTYAKRALRDYTAFLSRFEYTPDILAQRGPALSCEVPPPNNALSSQPRNQKSHNRAVPQNGFSGTLANDSGSIDGDQDESSDIRRPPIYKVSELFSAVAPSGLPPVPLDSQKPGARDRLMYEAPSLFEAVTYHPLMMDALHSLLLCHCLIRTSDKELKRHVYMVARIARICDGYPIFMPASSPSRADWIEILYESENWLGLERSWEDLCSPSGKDDQHHCKTTSDEEGKSIRADTMSSTQTQNEANEEESLSQVKQDAIPEPIANRILGTKAKFMASFRASNARALAFEDEEMRQEYNNIRLPRPSPTKISETKSTQKDKNTSSVPRQSSTEGRNGYIAIARSDLIIWWILEAPPPGSSGANSGTSRARTRKKKKGGPKAGIGDDKRPKREINADTTAAAAAAASSTAMNGLQQSIENLDILDKSTD